MMKNPAIPVFIWQRSKYSAITVPGFSLISQEPFTEREIDINAIHSKTSKQGIATIDISFNTKGKAELTSVIDKLRQIDSIIDIERTTG